MKSGNHPYQNLSAVLTTKHEKLGLIAPPLNSELGMNVILHEADTDLFGTFSGEIQRSLSAREAAIEKAKIGTSALGLRLGLASEGSIGPDPILPFVRSDIEHLALVDLDLGVEIVESFRSLEIVAGEIVTEPGDDLTEFLSGLDFPNHKLIVLPNLGPRTTVAKGVDSTATLYRAVEELAAISSDGKALVQSDLRAHCSPSRQANIKQAAQLLAQRLKALCLECKTPGWGQVGYERGLECSDCGELVGKAKKAAIYGCARCSFVELGSKISDYADPAICDACNP